MREPAAGDVLGSYRIVGKLSVGGMGTIYRARHELLDRPAAVKLLHPHLTADEELLTRFFNEAKAATKIRHPGIVEVYDFGYTEEGEAYLVMEFLEGTPLGKRMLEQGQFAEIEASTIARGIASALRAAHDKGIVHRDLKPDNVFLVPDADSPTGERVKVLDFGIAKLDGRSPSERARFTQTGVLMGTPLYMAPEQARAASAADHRADLYSLGCILYELLVGRPVFQAEGAGEVLVHHMFTQPTPPTGIRPDISPEMEDLVMRLLQKDPGARFPSAHEVVNALTALGAHLSARMSAQRAAASGRISAQRVSASGSYQPFPNTAPAEPRVASTHRVPPQGALRLTLIEESRTPAPPKRSAMPIVAAVLTAAIVAGVVVFFAVRGGGDPPPAPPPPTTAPEPKAQQPAPPPPPPPVTEKQPTMPSVVETPRTDRDTGSHKETRITPVPKPGSGSGSSTVKKQPPGMVTDNKSPISDKI